MEKAVRQKISAFRENLRQQEGERNGQVNNKLRTFLFHCSIHLLNITLQITLEFYEKKRRNWPLGEEPIPWELWILKIFVVRLNNESGTLVNSYAKLLHTIMAGLLLNQR